MVWAGVDAGLDIRSLRASDATHGVVGSVAGPKLTM